MLKTNFLSQQCKDVLFGVQGVKLDDGSEITEELRKKTWQKVYDACAAQNLPCCAADHDGSHLHYKVWPNFKDGLKKKLQNWNFSTSELWNFRTSAS